MFVVFGFLIASRLVSILHIFICSSRQCEKKCHILIGCLFVNLRLTHELCLGATIVLLICAAGRVTGSTSSLRDQQGHKKLVPFFPLKYAASRLQNRRFDSEVTHFYVPRILSLIKSTVLHINPFSNVGLCLFLNSPPNSEHLVCSIFYIDRPFELKIMQNSLEICA